MPRPKKSFSPEYKDEAVKMVIESSRPIARVAKELGINEGTLGNWVGAYRREHAGEEPPLTVNERARLRELERETREQKMELEFLKKAAAYFASDHRCPGNSNSSTRSMRFTWNRTSSTFRRS